MNKKQKKCFNVFKWIFIIFGGISFLFLFSILFDRIYYSGCHVPSHVTTISDFKKWQPTYTHTCKIEINGSIYYAVKGDFARSLPSAKSEYYFDSTGNYIGWNMDPGDFVTFPIIHKKEAIKSQIDIDDIGKNKQPKTDSQDAVPSPEI